MWSDSTFELKGRQGRAILKGPSAQVLEDIKNLKDAGLAEYASATDADALEGFLALATLEGILPALEPAHAIGWLLRAPLPEGSRVLVNLSGRGDKDLDTVRRALGDGAVRASG